MSVIVFSNQELSQVASSIYRKYGDFFDTYQERAVAKQEAQREIELKIENPRNDLDIRLDNFRWIWEKIALANKLEGLKRYTKYGESKSISYDEIDVLSGPEMNNFELYHKLESIRYNSSEFLDARTEEKLIGWINMVSSDLVRKIEVKA